MKTLSLKFESAPGFEMAPEYDSDLGKRRLTMRRGTNSSGPGGLTRRALRMGWLVAMAAGLMLTPGMSRADARSHGRGGHFSGGFGGFGGFQEHGHENQHGGRSNPGGYSRGSAQPGHGSQQDMGRGTPGTAPGAC